MAIMNGITESLYDEICTSLSDYENPETATVPVGIKDFYELLVEVTRECIDCREENTMENTTLNTTENVVKLNLVPEQPVDDGNFKHTPEGFREALEYFSDLSDREKEEAQFDCLSIEEVIRNWNADDFIDRCNEWIEAEEYDVIINVTVTKTVQRKALDAYEAMEAVKDEWDESDFDCPYDWDFDNVEFDYM